MTDTCDHDREAYLDNEKDWEIAIGPPVTEPHLGTAWCADGEGATIREFLCADICNMSLAHAARKQTTIISIYDLPRWDTPTNLRRTGHPLTPEDCARILSPRFKVGK